MKEKRTGFDRRNVCVNAFKLRRHKALINVSAGRCPETNCENPRVKVLRLHNIPREEYVEANEGPHKGARRRHIANKTDKRLAKESVDRF